MVDEVTPPPIDLLVPPEGNEAAKEKPTILVVEDDADTRASLSELFSEHGYAVVAVEDGQKAFEYLRGRKRPNAMVLDLWMPVMDGWTLAAEVMVGHLPSVPMVVITAASAGFAYPVPSRYVLRKPVNPDRLLRLVEEAVGAHLPDRGAE
jgi:CheY-like chemotaxis protein